MFAVSDLKVELKRRNLPVSGSKPQLIERLKPFTESSTSNSTSNSNGPHATHMGHILIDNTPGPVTTDESSSQAKSPSSVVKDEPNSPRTASPHNSEHDDPSSPPGKKKVISISLLLVKRHLKCFVDVFRARSLIRGEEHTWVFLRHNSYFRR